MLHGDVERRQTWTRRIGRGRLWGFAQRRVVSDEGDAERAVQADFAKHGFGA